MGLRTKSIITVLLLGSVIGIVTLQVQNKELLKGQIFDQNTVENTADAVPTGIERGEAKLPDLKPSIELERPATSEDDIIVIANIENIGEAPVTGAKSFKYAIYIDGTEAFSNTDTYSEMASGDSFSFTYPIPRNIYQYKDQGAVKLILDLNNDINESDEGNNTAELNYDFS
jgi:subtilase family serine protease